MEILLKSENKRIVIRKTVDSERRIELAGNYRAGREFQKRNVREKNVVIEFTVTPRQVKYKLVEPRRKVCTAKNQIF